MGTADRDSSRCRYSGNRRTRQLAPDFESNELIRRTTCMKIRGNLVSLSAFFPHPPEDRNMFKTRKKKKLAHRSVSRIAQANAFQVVSRVRR